MSNENMSYFERPVYDTDGNVMGFNRPGDPLPAGGSLVTPRPDKDPMATDEEISAARAALPQVETVQAPAPVTVKRGRGRPRKNPHVPGDLKNQNLTVRQRKPAGERKPRLSKRSIILKGMDFEGKRKTVIDALEIKLGKLSFVAEDKHEFAQVSYGGKDLFVKFKKLDKGNPDRSLMISVYPSDFRGKKIKPVARGYEKKGAIFMSRILDKVDKYVAK